MEVILLDDVKSLGKKGDLVKVSDGYARNFLLKKKLGVEATKENINDFKLKKKHDDKVAKEKLDEADALAAEMKEKTIKVSIKTGKNGKSFGSISTKELSEALKAQHGYDIDKKKMVLDVPIKNPGGYTLKIKLHPKVTAQMQVMVTEES